MWLDIRVEVLFSVVVGNFVSGFDWFFGVNKNSIAIATRFGIWTTGVVYVACNVFSRCAKNRFAVSQIKEITSSNLVRDFIWNELPPVFDNKSLSRNVFDREKTKASGAPTNAKGKGSRTGEWGSRHNSDEG